MSTPNKSFISREEYLAHERQAEYKSEYIAGEVVAMTGASRKHNLITTNIIVSLGQQLKGRPCELYPSDMRVFIPATNKYTYPDVVAVCEEPQFEDSNVDTLLNPKLIVEVLSDSTEAYDRGKKFRDYRSVESLAEYILIAQDEYRIEQYLRQSDGSWVLTEKRFLEDAMTLVTIQCSLALKDVYDKVPMGSRA
jgi:Uma2 family endonuclease